VRINGIQGLALTKIDVLTGIDPIRICVAYEYNGQRYEHFPASMQVLRNAQPVYEEHPGWNEPLTSARTIEDLPRNARRYIQRLEELTETPMYLISVGANRNETILLRNPFHS
jgi:adenylosuccinate synthase